jgi:hypothetical protein
VNYGKNWFGRLRGVGVWNVLLIFFVKLVLFCQARGLKKKHRNVQNEILVFSMEQRFNFLKIFLPLSLRCKTYSGVKPCLTLYLVFFCELLYLAFLYHERTVFCIYYSVTWKHSIIREEKAEEEEEKKNSFLHLFSFFIYRNTSDTNQPLGANCTNETQSMMWKDLFENIQGEVGGLF